MNAILSDLVSVKGRFHRSVQLVKDWKDAEHLEGYILTPNGQSLTERILKGLSQSGQPRTWSITGPYGSGKSSFALFLADTLASAFPRTSMGQAIRSRTGFHLAPFFPLLLVGQRRPLHQTLKEAIHQTLTAEFPDLEPELRRWSDPEVRAVDLLERATLHLSRKSRGGLLLILDEFGKFLEYAAQNPQDGDLFLMQELAEFASRSAFPVALITVLHTGFSDYLLHAEHTARAEWQKVQGRFTDVNFQEPAEQFLQLIASAVDFRSGPELSKAYACKVREVLESEVLEEARKRIPALDAHLLRCVPIEPITALLLWPLFRSKLAQNERSLFAFLTGSEPFGLLDFLTSQDTDSGQLPMYTLSQLYQYVVHSLGSATYQSDLSRRWSLIEVACDRLGEGADPLLKSLVQAIGLISSYGSQVGLKATRETLIAACGDSAEVDEALSELKRKSLVLYRNFESTYALWDGSDMDLDEEFAQVMAKQGQFSLARSLQRHLELYPQVARAHYIRTGNLRSFEVTLFEGRSTELSTHISKLKPDQLQIIFVLSSTDTERKQLQLIAQFHAANTNVIFAFPRPVVGLEGFLRELNAWETIKRTSTSLEGDPVAKKELEGRIQQAQERLENTIGSLFGVKGYRFEPSKSEWFHAGAPCSVPTARHFQQWLSQILDWKYHLSPVIRNELLNRNQLSSQSAKARRNLLEAMLLQNTQPRLGMEGFPPEYSMYAAVLKKGGFHREVKGHWQLTAPEGSYEPVWQAMLEHLTAREDRVPLTGLFDLLRGAPYGIAEGPIPVLVAALLISMRERIAIFDEGLFVPELRIEVLERIVRRPDLFEVQWIEFTSSTLQALQDMSEAIRMYAGKPERIGTPLLMDVVKPLILVAAKLPPYSRFTRKLDPPSAVLLRDMLLRIKDPVQLVTQDILALYHTTIEGETHPKSLTSWLLDCLNAMGSAFGNLLYQIEMQIREAFQLSGSFAEVSQNLRSRAEQLRGYTVDQTLTAFVQQLGSASADQWREQLGRVVHSGKPVTDWRDGDLLAFQVKLRQMASDFHRLEELVRERGTVPKDAGVQVIRIGVLGTDLREDRKVFSLREDQKQQAEQLSHDLLAEFQKQTGGLDINVTLSALALLTQKIIGGPHE
ncbi:hypothetical protein [Deinococcus roseus]|uniref:ATP-binding protein n=1 Tax=Deinococcus roseus TaxID=392414 RepID=A0ABQ2D0S6_9DEIO|nr:hypothetical protein [Deinococcus roseus]GGJ36300.1 hypothetical protein GCM10008938_23000 [Deinococcus roseus]